MTVVALEYIEVDDRGVAKLIGSRIKVRHLVLSQQANGFSAEQLVDEFAHLPAAQIYAALAYYHAHRADVDAEIEASSRFADEMQAKYGNPHARAELEARWRAKFGTEPPGVGPADDA